MKLYTEEQVNELRRALRDIRDWNESLEDDWEDVGYRAMDVLKIFTKTTPIELPTDEDIEKYINSFPYTKHLDDGQYNDGVIVGIELGIEWYKEQLKNKL